MLEDWFVEKENKELTFGYAVKERLYTGISEYQKIDVFETKAYGRMLVIDDVVMLTDTDEFVYHEMISHVPVCYHHQPESVLVIGGGDGGEGMTFAFLSETDATSVGANNAGLGVGGLSGYAVEIDHDGDGIADLLAAEPRNELGRALSS